MQILLTLEHSIDYSEAEGIVEDFLDSPWCADAKIVRSEHCGKCAAGQGESVPTDNQQTKCGAKPKS